jgi:hypothetical protein
MAEGPAAATYQTLPIGTASSPGSPTQDIPTSTVVTQRVARFSKGIDDSAVRGDLCAGNHQPSPPGRNGPAGLSGDRRQAVVESPGDSVQPSPFPLGTKRRGLAKRNQYGAMKRSRS